jgi:hydrogenase maturation protease
MFTAAGGLGSIRETDCSVSVTHATVLGIGNILLSDDGAGVKVADYLRDELSGLGVDVIDGGTLSYTLLPLIEDATVLIAIDAGQVDSDPGTVQVFEGAAMDEYLARRPSGTVHEVGLADLMDMARLRDALPERRALVAIQPSSVDWGDSLTPEVEKAVPTAATHVRRLLGAWS